MTEREMLEAEKYWCENCCNWDKEEVQMDACSTCKLTGTRVFAQESGKECKCFNVPAENVIVTPCVAMVEQFIKGGELDKRLAEHNGKYAVVYVDKSKWSCPLIDITEQHYNAEKAIERIQVLKGGAE